MTRHSKVFLCTCFFWLNKNFLIEQSYQRYWREHQKQVYCTTVFYDNMWLACSVVRALAQKWISRYVPYQIRNVGPPNIHGCTNDCWLLCTTKMLGYSWKKKHHFNSMSIQFIDCASFYAVNLKRHRRTCKLKIRRNDEVIDLRKVLWCTTSNWQRIERLLKVNSPSFHQSGSVCMMRLCSSACIDCVDEDVMCL